MDSQLEKILQVAKKTGDKIIVLADNNEFVVTSLDEYSRLIDGGERIGSLTESEMLDKINRDIAAWRAHRQELDSQQDDLSYLDEAQAPSYQSLDNLAVQDKTDKLSDNFNDLFDNGSSRVFHEMPWQDKADEQPELEQELADTFAKESSQTEPIDSPFNDGNLTEDNSNEDTKRSGSFNFEQDNVSDKSSNSEPPAGTFDIDTQDDPAAPDQQQSQPIMKNKKNNFGYLNPADTVSYNIPPPPDIDKNT